jgi:DNA modification methylase
MDYTKKTIPELKVLCKERNIKNVSGKLKSDIISLLTPTDLTPTDLTPTDLTPTEAIESAKDPSPAVEPVLDVLADASTAATPASADKNTYTVGDNITLLRCLSSESIDMIYMDPPYNTGRNFYYFQDKFADFPKFMYDRLVECHRVLKRDGNIIIHVEPRISHHIRVICDKLFGESNFKNEIVWHSGGNAKNKYQLGRNHDTIIVYGKSSRSKFFPLYKPYSEEHKKSQKMCTIHNKLYSTSAAHNSQPEVNPRPNLTYEWNGHLRQWCFSKEKIQLLHDDDRLEYNEKGIPRIKRFLEEMEGIPVRDTWDDISSIQNGEKTRYATQKPIRLLDRVLSLYSAEGDTCLDPFAGSGTVGRSCKNLGRNYILFDINSEGREVFESSI